MPKAANQWYLGRKATKAKTLKINSAVIKQSAKLIPLGHTLYCQLTF